MVSDFYQEQDRQNVGKTIVAVARLKLTRGEAGKQNYKDWRERRAAVLLTCEREGHDWVWNPNGHYCRRCRLAKEFA